MRWCGPANIDDVLVLLLAQLYNDVRMRSSMAVKIAKEQESVHASSPRRPHCALSGSREALSGPLFQAVSDG